MRDGFEEDLAEYHGEADHLHPQVNYPPKAALPRPVNSLKGLTTRRIRQDVPDLTRRHYRAHNLWSTSYRTASARAGGAPLTVLRHHIEQHNRPG